MRIAVTGYNGRLGSELVKLGCLPLHCDVTQRKTIDAALKETNPDIIVHCASMTDVDACEDRKMDAIDINAGGTENLKIAFDGKIIYISTDYVFNGKKGMYTELDKPSDPTSLCWYGYTKLLGEQLLGKNDTIVRTTILYGCKHKFDFVSKIILKLEVGEPFEVTRALHGTPTYVPHLAEAIMYMINENKMPNVVNIVGRDYISRYEFALMVASVFGYEKKKELIIPSLKVGRTLRPRKAGLNIKKALQLGIPCYDVPEGLAHALANQNIMQPYVQLEMKI